MFYSRMQIIYWTYLVLLEVSFLHAQKGTSTSFDEGSAPNLVKSRFFDPANMGFTNFGPGRLGNLGSNYPTGPPFFPIGNQFPNFQSGPDYEWDIQNQYPNQGNFQRPQDGVNQNQGIFPKERGTFRPELNSILDHIKPNQINARTTAADDVSLLRINRPYRFGEPNFQRSQSNEEALQFSESSKQNLILNSNFEPDLNYYQNTQPPFFNRPINDHMENTQYPRDKGSFQKHQYPAQDKFTYLRNSNIRTGLKVNAQPPYVNVFSNLQIPKNNQGELKYGYHPDHNLDQIPRNRSTGNNYGPNFNDFNDAPQIISKIPDQYEQFASDETDSDHKVAILGKPVIVPSESIEPLDVDKKSFKNAVQKQCVQDCETSSEYNPICGTNNVTYINPEKFACARNCGVDVRISRHGRCNDDPVYIYARQ